MNTVITEKFMPTKASIVQRLLDEKQITAEEAVVLLNDRHVPHYTTIDPAQPYYPKSPNPFFPTSPYVYCGTTGDKNNTLNVK